jgi:hypothetical protein
MEEKIVSVLQKYKGNESNVLRVSVMSPHNSNQHVVIRTKDNGEINVIECSYENLANVKDFLAREFPATQIVER